jgi:hypothetical protein
MIQINAKTETQNPNVQYSEAHSMLVQNQASNSTQQPLRYCSEHEFKLYSTSIDPK